MSASLHPAPAASAAAQPRIIPAVAAVRHLAPDARVVESPGIPVHVRIEGAPPIAPDGLVVEVRLRVDDPATGTPQVAVAHAEHATGWSLGIDGSGQPTLTLGTALGPVSLRTPATLTAGAEHALLARIPGEAPGVVTLVHRDAEGCERSATVRIGAAVVPSRGPLLWGCRSLYDGVRPELILGGEVSDVRLSADADGGSAPALLGAWEGGVRVGRRSRAV